MMIHIINLALLIIIALCKLSYGWLILSIALELIGIICVVSVDEYHIQSITDTYKKIKDESSEFKTLYYDAKEKLEELKIANEAYKGELIRIKKREYINDIDKITQQQLTR